MMNKFRQAYNIFLSVWHVMSDYRDKDVTQDDLCKEVVDKLNDICRTYPEKAERTLVSKVSTALLEYVSQKSDA